MTAMDDERYNVERFGSLFNDIYRYIRDLEDLGICDAEKLKDKRNFYAASMILFSLLNRVFDLGSEMLIAGDMGIPSRYRDIFIILHKNGLIDSVLTNEMIGLVTYRNLLSHEYHGIDEEKLFSLTKKIGIVRQFVDAMQTEIRNSR